MRELPSTPIGQQKSLVMDGLLRAARNHDGRSIHWSEEGVRNFWRWFGDSRVVNKHGLPLLVYHGTTRDFGGFKKDGVEPNFTSPQQHLGHFSRVR